MARSAKSLGARLGSSPGGEKALGPHGVHFAPAALRTPANALVADLDAFRPHGVGDGPQRLFRRLGRERVSSAKSTLLIDVQALPAAKAVWPPARKNLLA